MDTLDRSDNLFHSDHWRIQVCRTFQENQANQVWQNRFFLHPTIMRADCDIGDTLGVKLLSNFTLSSKLLVMQFFICATTC